MKILYHKDDDGRCAAAIINREFDIVFNPMTKDDFIGYIHGDELAAPEPKEDRPNEQIFIVDISLDSTIEKFITTCLEHGCKVVHIDHHKTGIDYFNKLSENSPLKTDANYKTFFKVGVSGTLLSWIYTYMTEEERDHANDIPFDFAHEMTHVAIDYTEDDPSKMREYHIPPGIRFIDDYDVWKLELSETKQFHAGLEAVKDKHPLSDIWNKVVYDNNPRSIIDIISTGRVIIEYKEAQNERIMSGAFEWSYNDIKLLCVNASIHGSAMFGDKIESYDAVCVYHFNGKHWAYSMYSKEDGADVSKLVQEIGDKFNAVSAGGHAHAAGMILDKYIF